MSDDMDTKKMRICAPMLPPPGDEIAVQCLNEIDKLRAALDELIECKDLRDWISAAQARLNTHKKGTDGFPEKWDEYQRRQPLAWGAARRLRGKT